MPRGRRVPRDSRPSEMASEMASEVASEVAGRETFDAVGEPFRSWVHVDGGYFQTKAPAHRRCGATRGCARRACPGPTVAHRLARGDAARAATSGCAPAAVVAARGRNGMRRGGDTRSSGAGGAGITEGSCTIFGTSSAVPCEPSRTIAGWPPGRRAGAFSLAGKRPVPAVHAGAARRGLSEVGLDRGPRRHFLGL